jgi:hypothetical protein
MKKQKDDGWESVSFTWSPEKTIELTPEEERELRECEAKYEKLWLERQRRKAISGYRWIRLRGDTYWELSKLKLQGESFDDLVGRLVEFQKERLKERERRR